MRPLFSAVQNRSHDPMFRRCAHGLRGSAYANGRLGSISWTARYDECKWKNISEVLLHRGSSGENHKEKTIEHRAYPRKCCDPQIEAQHRPWRVLNRRLGMLRLDGTGAFVHFPISTRKRLIVASLEIVYETVRPF